MRGISHFIANVVYARILKVSRPGLPVSFSVAFRMPFRCSVISARYCSPEYVRIIALGSRRNNRVPNCLSRDCTWRLTAPGVTWSSSAALRIFFKRPAASKARNGLSEGRHLFIVAALDWIEAAANGRPTTCSRQTRNSTSPPIDPAIPHCSCPRSWKRLARTGLCAYCCSGAYSSRKKHTDQCNDSPIR